MARLLLLFWCWSAGCCWAGANPSAWLALSPSGQQVYLVGSVHLGTASFYPLAPALERAFRSADVLAVELDITQLEPAPVAALMQRLGFFAPGQAGLNEGLSPALAAKLQDFCTLYAVCPPAAERQRMRPWLLSLQITNHLMAQSAYQPALGVDRYFLARRGDKKLVELESLERQMGIFAGLSQVAQQHLLDSTLMEPQASMEYLDDMVQAWRRGDDAVLSELVLEPVRLGAGGASLYQSLFVVRNQAMAERIAQLAKVHDTTFVVVGAGHLLGNDGLPSLLRTQGFSVNPL